MTAVLAMYWLAMFAGTHMPRIPVRMDGGGTDKWLHFGAYFGLAILLSARLFQRRAPFAGESAVRCKLRLSAAAVVLAIGLVYGFLDEWLQGFVGRDPDFWDWVADSCGTVCGIVTFRVLCPLLGPWLVSHVGETRPSSQESAQET